VGKGNNIELLGLQEAYLGWGLMKVISEWEASRNESLVGDQGKGDVTCNCKSACDSNRCSCFRAGRMSSEVESKTILMGHPILCCHAPVVGSFFFHCEVIISP
jgi:hypothetical protein